MIWLCWRQFRVHAATSLALLVGAALYLVPLGSSIRSAQDELEARCRGTETCAQLQAQLIGQYENRFLYLAAVLYLVVIAIGMFWGAPLVSGELEMGTHRMVWNQGVTRTRWLVSKVAFAGSASVLVMGILSGLMTWAAEPIDALNDQRFTTLIFGARHIAPAAYGLFAVCLGAFVGVCLRRRLPAMAVTGALLAAVLFLVPNVVRPHLMPPEHENRPMTAEAINAGRSLGSITGAAAVGGLHVPDAWVSDSTALLRADGSPLPEADFGRCLTDPPRTGAGGTFGDTAVCLGDLDLHVRLTYQPNNRYWPFQWLESLLYTSLGALLGLGSLWLLRRRV